MKRFKDLPRNIKLFIALIVVLTIGIILRWNVIKKDVVRGFRFFSTSEQTDSTKAVTK